MSASNPILTTRALEVRVAGRQLCRQLDLQVYGGQCWAILGPNGAGKTTLLHSLLGLHGGAQGAVEYFGRALHSFSRRELARHVGLLPQDLEDPFPSTVLDTALIGRHPHLRRWAWEGEEDLRLARRSLQRVGLEDFEGRSVNTLSGGERRRLGVATLLTQSPRMFLLDEPVNHLDLPHQHSLMQTLRGLAQHGEQAVVMVLHDVNLARRYCDHALLLHAGGEVQSGASGAVLNTRNLERLYGHPLHRVASPVGEVFVPG